MQRLFIVHSFYFTVRDCGEWKYDVDAFEALFARYLTLPQFLPLPLSLRNYLVLLNAISTVFAFGLKTLAILLLVQARSVVFML